MNITGLFSKGESVWMKSGSELETITFTEASVEEIHSEGMVLLLDDQTLKSYSVEDIKEGIFKKSFITDLAIEGFLNYEKNQSKYNFPHSVSKRSMYQNIKDEMLTLQFCEACQSNHGIHEEIEVEGLKHLGTIHHFFGEVDNYRLEGVYQLNGNLYVSYDAGNSHCHIGLMEEEMAKELKAKLSSNMEDVVA